MKNTYSRRGVFCLLYSSSTSYFFPLNSACPLCIFVFVFNCYTSYFSLRLFIFSLSFVFSSSLFVIWSLTLCHLPSVFPVQSTQVQILYRHLRLESQREGKKKVTKRQRIARRLLQQLSGSSYCCARPNY